MLICILTLCVFVLVVAQAVLAVSLLNDLLVLSVVGKCRLAEAASLLRMEAEEQFWSVAAAAEDRYFALRHQLVTRGTAAMAAVEAKVYRGVALVDTQAARLGGFVDAQWARVQPRLSWAH